MKKIYNNPTVELLILSVEDIIALSTNQSFNLEATEGNGIYSWDALDFK